MDYLTPSPSPSFRPHQRHRRRHLSPSPSRRAFARDATPAVYITTDYDHSVDHDPSDPELIFHMSPVHSHLFASSSPALSPLLYSFPRPPAHDRSSTTKNTARDGSSMLISSSSSSSSSSRRRRGLFSPQRRPLVASLVEGPGFPTCCNTAKSLTPPSTPAHQQQQQQGQTRHHILSSPIPIPRRQCAEVGSRPPAGLIGSDLSSTPGGLTHRYAASPVCRIEGFGDGDGDEEEEEEEAVESAGDSSRSGLTSSTAYSSYASPFRLTKLLDYDDELWF